MTSEPPSYDGLPHPRRDPVERSLHGVTRVDPYAWMRELDSPEVLAHLEAERAYYDAAVRHTAPLVRDLTAAIDARIPDTEHGPPVDRHRFVYYTLRAGGRENGEFRRHRRPTVTESVAETSSDDQLVLDVDALRGESAYVDLGVREVSPDEDLIAYSVDVVGDEVYQLRFRDLRTGTDLLDVVPRSSFTGAWSADSRSFFYTVHDSTFRAYQVRRHDLGTDPAGDAVLFDEPDPQFEVSVRACRSGRLVVVTSQSRDTTEEWLVDATDPAAPARCVEPRRRGHEYAVEHAPYDGTDRLLVVTNEGAPEFHVVWAPTEAPGVASWRLWAPDDPSARIQSVDAFRDFVVVSLRSAGRPRLQVHDPSGQLRFALEPPRCGHIELAETPRWDSPSLTVLRTSYVEPRVWSAVDATDGSEQVVHREEVPSYDPADYVTYGMAFSARDRTTVPVTLVHRRDVPLDRTAPCLMYGYGAYEVVFPPEFDPAVIALLDRGVVFAHVGVRGGGDYGRRWWLDGRMEHKHHTFEDHIDAAEALGREYVDPDRIATRGLSAGGLLQGAVFSQRPDLWRAVLAEVPFVDVVTTMLDPSIPLTANEWDEWGDPRRAADFGWMFAYSPYDNLPLAGGRPDLLVTGALHDARVMVWEPAKWVAALRDSDPGWALRCLFRVDTGAGAHAGPTGRHARSAYEAEVYAWVLERLLG